MNEIASRDRLQSLRDEVYAHYTSSRSTELYHAMMIVEGRSLWSKELEERWDRFTKSNFLPPPLPPRGTYRRDISFNSVEVCLFGHIDGIELRRFKSQAEAIRSAATEYLSSQRIDFGPIPRGINGLSHLLYCLAWDHPSHVTYAINTHNYLDRLSDLDQSPFASRETFEAWEVGKLDLGPGYYFAKLSMDLRSCTVSATDAILGLSASEIVEPGKRAPVREQSIEDRDKWLYEKCCKGIIYKNIVSELKTHTEWEPIDSIQGIRHVAKAYAKRHDLPEPPSRRS